MFPNILVDLWIFWRANIGFYYTSPVLGLMKSYEWELSHTGLADDILGGADGVCVKLKIQYTDEKIKQIKIFFYTYVLTECYLNLDYFYTTKYFPLNK